MGSASSTKSSKTPRSHHFRASPPGPGTPSSPCRSTRIRVGPFWPQSGPIPAAFLGPFPTPLQLPFSVPFLTLPFSACPSHHAAPAQHAAQPSPCRPARAPFIMQHSPNPSCRAPSYHAAQIQVALSGAEGGGTFWVRVRVGDLTGGRPYLSDHSCGCGSWV